MRYTTVEKEAMANAIKSNDYETYKRYLPSAYSEEAKQSAYTKAGGLLSSVANPNIAQTDESGGNSTMPQTTPAVENEGGLLDNYASDNKVTPKYLGGDFLKWYSSNYGSDYDPNKGFQRAEGMNDVDWGIGNEAFKYYASGEKIDNQHKTAINSLDADKRNSQQSASMTLDKLKRYLPTQIKAQGLGGLGVGASTMLQANNNYMNQMGNIAANYNDNKTALEQAYGTDKTNLELDANNATDEIYDKYLNNYENKQEQLRKEAAQKAENDRVMAQDNVAATISEYIGLGRIDDARAYAEKNRATLGEDWYRSYETRMEADIKAKEDLDQENADTRILEGKEYVSYNGANYQIKSQLNGDSNEIKRNNDFKQQLQAKCGTTNPYDSEKISNGTTFAVKTDNKGSNDFNWWDDVGAAMLSPLWGGAWNSWGNWNTVYMTYYNGNWYKSDKK